MEYQKYIERKKVLLAIFHQFIEDENSSEEDFQNLVEFLKTPEYEEDATEFKLFLHIINNISNNHYRYPTFLSKIEQILTFFADHIKVNFTNYEIFDVFQNNKRILLFLIKHQIITIDYFITKKIIKKDENKHIFIDYYRAESIGSKEIENYNEQKQMANKSYQYYFFPEIKEFLKEESRLKIEKEIQAKYQNTLDEFYDKRQSGENEKYICKIIREDSVKEFDIYINKTNYPLSSRIDSSIFETHPLLQKREATLIEYSAFFGSIQIFQYLRMKKVNSTQSLWQYAVHGNNPEIIHILEEDHIKPEDESFIKILQESIKCHHNNIANYILNSFMVPEVEINENNFICNQSSFGFRYHNYEFIHNFMNHQFNFYYACLYDFFSIIKLLIKIKAIDLAHRVIQLFVNKTEFYIQKCTFFTKFQFYSFNYISILFVFIQF